MLTEPLKAAFFAAAQVRGKIIETIITAFYEELAAQWEPGAVLIDGGSNRGYHSRRMAALDSVERVIAVEANPVIGGEFQAVIDRSPKLANVDLRLFALQDDPAREFIEFHVSTSHHGRSGVNPVMRGRDGTVFGTPIRVPATTIDQLTEGMRNRVRFIKLDLEGGEFGAFRGARLTLSAAKPVCVFENGPMTPGMNGYTPREVLDFFEQVGMAVSNFYGEAVTEETLTGFWYAWAFPKDEFADQTARLRRLVRVAVEEDVSSGDITGESKA